MSQPVVAFGDSITCGSHHLGPAGNWTHQLERTLPIRLVNAGVGGNTSRQGLERLHRDVLIHDPGLVVINFGMNDSALAAPATPKVPLEEFRANLESMVEGVLAFGASVVLVTTNGIIEGDTTSYYYSRHDPSWYGPLMGARFQLETYVASVRDLGADRGLPVADVYEAFQSFDPLDFLVSLRNSPTADGVHPHDVGARVYYQTILPHVEGWLKQRSLSHV